MRCRTSCSISRIDVRIVCPACGKKAASDLAAIDAVLAVLACDRCGCDLSALRDIRLAAAANLRLAKSALERREWDEALGFAARSWTLARGEASVAAACLAAAARGDAATLNRWQRRSEDLRK